MLVFLLKFGLFSSLIENFSKTRQCRVNVTVFHEEKTDKLVSLDILNFFFLIIFFLSIELRYVYDCTNSVRGDVTPETCTERKTNAHKAAGFSILGLEYHDVKCTSGEALSSFRMKAFTGISWDLQYIYTCCKLEK